MTEGPVASLLKRLLLVNFRVTPPPVSLSHSLAIYSYIDGLVNEGGRIVHYRQNICPVTKQRLEGLRILVEDYGRNDEHARVALVGSHTQSPTLTELEKTLFALRNPSQIESSKIELVAATRDPATIQKLREVRAEPEPSATES